MKKLLISLHDVAPTHLDRMRRAEDLFRRLEVPAVQYLFVPDFHARAPASESPAFRTWCREARPWRVDWVLHGYFHLDHVEEGGGGGFASLNAAERLKATFLTGNEGEFLRLDADAQRRRIRAGLEEFSRCFPGQRPEGFIPPAWLFRKEVLIPVLREFDLDFTEDHQGIYDVRGGAFRRAPVVTWATRTFARRVGSLVVCPLRARWFAGEETVRLAMHPHDFDFPSTAASIESTLRHLMQRRDAA